jgi:hypothetical protein
VLLVETPSAQWSKEVMRSSPVILKRLQSLLGADSRRAHRGSPCVNRSSSPPCAQPTGKFLGALKGFTATELGAWRSPEAVRRAGIDPQIVDECIMGNVVSAGLGQNPARQAALNGGLPNHVAALTINKVCGSGLKAVMLADQGIRVGDIDVAVAGGMESMSNAPYLLPACATAAHGQRRSRGRDDSRRPVVRVRAVPHGATPARWSPSTTTSAAPRRTTTPRAVIRRRRAHQRRRLRRRDPGDPHSAEEGDPLVFDRDEAIAPTRRRRGSPRSSRRSRRTAR